ncbi:glycoside hydrolase family 13 protein [Brevibacterium rongguiense]|nr:glycoside hydrolase family 13 protein [Brevibacterium rongguiense]
MSESQAPWWADAVIYQIYPRSFADSDGDGMGDLPGITARLDYLAGLGVDAVWLSPFYRSPQRDAGYDVADYRSVDPMFGTLADAEALISRAHALGLRVIVDLVPNHTSDEHAWFRAALAAQPGSPERARYHFADGRGAHGELPPNNWSSVFGGGAWTRTADAAGRPGQWYLHLFDSSQPDLNWDSPEVHAEFAAVLRYWLDRGADGFRVDVAHGLVKAEGLPDHAGTVHMVSGADDEPAGHDPMAAAPYFDQEGVHAIYREWNAVLAQYPGQRMLVAEAWVEPVERLFRYVRPGEMHQAFNFGFLVAGYDAAAIDASVRATLEAARSVGAPATWVLSNHDTVRHSARFGLAQAPAQQRGIGAGDPQPDHGLGRRRAIVAAMIELALPGSAYLYQGDELALTEHTVLADELRQDPAYFRTAGADLGRDGARIPLPWDSQAPGLGFGPGRPGDAAPWLPQPAEFAALAVDRQEARPGSALHLYRTLLHVRRARGMGRARLRPGAEHDPAGGLIHYVLDSPEGTTEVLANLSARAREIAPRAVLAASSPEALRGTLLPADAAVWAAAD